MTDQNQEQNLPVEDESTLDPVRLPETIEKAPLLPEEGLGEVGVEQLSSPPAGGGVGGAMNRMVHGGGGSNKEEVLSPRHPELASALRSSESEGRDSESPEEPEEITEEEEEEPEGEAVPANIFDDNVPGHWYVLHTYSGYEDAVAESLHQRIDSLDMKDKIFHVLVPKEKQIEIKNGKRKTVDKKIFPGYVLVKMLVTEASWYVVRNTPSVTGFIGSGTIPVPISDAEMETIKKRMVVEEPKHKIDLKLGDLVHIIDGPFKEYDGTVGEVDEARGKIKVLVSIFGRETPVELDFLQVKRA